MNIHEAEENLQGVIMGKSSLRIIIRTIFITYILTAIFLLLLAFGLYQLHLSESQVNLGINVIYIVTCFIGGVLAGKAAKVKRFLWGFFSGTAYFLVLLAVSFLIHQSIGSNMNELALIFAMCAGSGTIGGMIS